MPNFKILRAKLWQLRGQKWTRLWFHWPVKMPQLQNSLKKSTNDRKNLKKFTKLTHYLILKCAKFQNSTSKIVAAVRSNVKSSLISLASQDAPTSKFAKKSTNDRKNLKKFTKFTHYLIFDSAKFQNSPNKIVAATRSNVKSSLIWFVQDWPTTWFHSFNTESSG